MLEAAKDIQLHYKAKQDALQKRLGNFHGIYNKLEDLVRSCLLNLVGITLMTPY